MLRRAAILKRICDRRRAQNTQKMKCNIYASSESPKDAQAKDYLIFSSPQRNYHQHTSRSERISFTFAPTCN